MSLEQVNSKLLLLRWLNCMKLCNVAEIIRKAKNVSALVVIGSRKQKETNKEYMELISLEII